MLYSRNYTCYNRIFFSIHILSEFIHISWVNYYIAVSIDILVGFIHLQHDYPLLVVFQCNPIAYLPLAFSKQPNHLHKPKLHQLMDLVNIHLPCQLISLKKLPLFYFCSKSRVQPKFRTIHYVSMNLIGNFVQDIPFL